MRKVLITALACVGFGATNADAAACNANADVTITSLATASFHECTLESGNDTGGGSTFLADLESGAIFGIAGDWDLFGKSDEDNFLTADQGSDSGDWSLDGNAPNLTGTTVITLKAGNEFQAFLFKDLAFSVLGGTFNTGDKDLSHLSIFTGPTTVIPLPAAAWLLLSGVAGLGLFGRGRRAA